jgi:ribosomal protein S18 acetylase RimI-like enzyme
MFQITLRDIEPQDEQFLLDVYASTRQEELARVPWSESQRDSFLRMQFLAQQSYYRERFPNADYKKILLNGMAAGRLYVLRDQNAINILDITVIPHQRNKGIGTTLIRELLNEATESGRRIQIYVETFNPSLKFFEQLGFCRIAEEGINYLLEWRPA